MKYTPIRVLIPGSDLGGGSESLTLTPNEANVLKQRLEREIARWEFMVGKTGGVRPARVAMAKYYERRSIS
jgi:hypothetical protein